MIASWSISPAENSIENRNSVSPAENSTVIQVIEVPFDTSVKPGLQETVNNHDSQRLEENISEENSKEKRPRCQQGSKPTTFPFTYHPY